MLLLYTFLSKWNAANYFLVNLRTLYTSPQKLTWPWITHFSAHCWLLFLRKSLCWCRCSPFQWHLWGWWWKQWVSHQNTPVSWASAVLAAPGWIICSVAKTWLLSRSEQWSGKSKPQHRGKIQSHLRSWMVLIRILNSKGNFSGTLISGSQKHILLCLATESAPA